MTKAHIKELLSIITQIVPFLIITVVFIGFAYTSGHTNLLCQEDISTMMKLSCNCFP